MSTLKNVYESRREAQEELKGLYAEHGTEDLSAEVRAAEVVIADRISDLQEREGNLIAMDARDRAADEARALSPVPVIEPPVPPVPSMHDRLNALRRGEVRSVEIGYEARDLVSDTSGDGQELVESDLLKEIHDLVVDYSPIMGLSRQIRTSMGNDLILPRVTSHSAAALVAEAGAIGESDPQFDTVTLGAYKYAFAVQISRELESDSAFNVASFVTAEGGAALGRGLDAAFATGSGSAQPQGLDNATSGKTTAAIAAVTADELLDLQHSVLRPQRAAATFVFSDATILAIRKLTDGQGNYLWAPGGQAGAPDTLFGNNVISNPNVADMATGVTFGVFGDLSGFYTRLAGGVSVDRSEHVAFLNDLITYRFLVRADSVIVDTTGIRTIDNA